MAGKTATSLLPASMCLILLLAGWLAAATLASPAAQRQQERRFVGSANNKLPQQDMTMMRRGLTTCGSEIDACTSDSACNTCYNDFLDDAFKCDPTGEGLSCSEAKESYCCGVAHETEDCESNGLLTDMIHCVWEDNNGGSGCDFDVGDDCSGASGRSSFWGASTGLFSAAVAGLLIAAFGVAV